MVKTTVAAILTNPEKTRFLLTRRMIEPFKDHWCLPGGHIDRYEPALVSAEREVREETGLDVSLRFHSYCDEIMPEFGIHAVVIVFEGIASGNTVAQPDEVAEIRWFTPAKITDLPMAFLHRDIINSYLTEKS
jgi:8-oxo-dGTP diphosphatase